VAAPARRLAAHISSLSGALSDLVSKRKLDAAMIDELEERSSAPISASRLPRASPKRSAKADMTRSFAGRREGDFRSEIEKVLAPVAQPLTIDPTKNLSSSGDRRERFRQDHDHRQTRREINR
jgi:hypothetical protein